MGANQAVDAFDSFNIAVHCSKQTRQQKTESFQTWKERYVHLCGLIPGFMALIARHSPLPRLTHGASPHSHMLGSSGYCASAVRRACRRLTGKKIPKNVCMCRPYFAPASSSSRKKR